LIIRDANQVVAMFEALLVFGMLPFWEELRSGQAM
jgi:hypothetical protein